MVPPYHTIRPLHSTPHSVLHFPSLARVQPPAPCCTLPHQHTPTTPCHTSPLGRRCLLDIGSSGPSGRVHRVRVGRVHPAATRPPPDRHPSTQSDVTPLVTRSSHRVTARHRRPPTSPPWHARRFSTWISRRLHGTDFPGSVSPGAATRSPGKLAPQHLVQEIRPRPQWDQVSWWFLKGR